ncbi:MAG: dihydroneopterin aldolase [Microthrixaceae bacterium]
MAEQGSVGTPDRISLHGLRLVGIVGVLPEERVRAQPLQIDLDLYLDLSAAGMSDALLDTVDYGAVCESIDRTVQTAQPELLERLATQLAAAVFEVDTRIESLEISVAKLRPPVPQDLATSGVQISRRRPA